MNSLFNEYTELKDKIPYLNIAELPTPVKYLPDISKQLPGAEIYIKEDSLSAAKYGGNKVRKLEFLLARALADGNKSLITFGAAGSNHALATAIYAKEHNIHCALILMRQANAKYVRKNLLMHERLGTELIPFDEDIPIEQQTLKLSRSLQERFGTQPMVIPFGGTTPLGTLGTVNAAFELKKQIESALLPVPDYIYTAFGSMGTAAGLILGLKAACLKTKVICVAVVDGTWSNEERLNELLAGTNKLLHEICPDFPLMTFSSDDYELTYDFFGKDYAVFTEKGIEAVRLLKEKENIQLEGTYTGKAFSAVINHAKSGSLKGKTVLFWNTYNSAPLDKYIADADYRKLPAAFHHYFEDETHG